MTAPRRTRTTAPRKKRGQTSLGFAEIDSKEVVRPRVFVLSSSYAIGPLLARGCLLAGELDGDGVWSPRPTSPESLPWNEDGIPRVWVDAIAASARNAIPIAILLKEGRRVQIVPMTSTRRKPEYVLLDDVEALFFRTTKELDRFRSVPFSNYSLEALALDLRVGPEVFQGGNGLPPEGLVSAPTLPRVDATTSDDTTIVDELAGAREIVRRADSLAGFVAALLHAAPGRREWMEGIGRLLSGQTAGDAVVGSLPERIALAMIGTPPPTTETDDVLLESTVRVLRRYPEERGWPAEEVLSAIEADYLTNAERMSRRAIEELARWSKKARSVLASTVEPQPLDDDGFIVQRAVLLVLLRGEVESIDAAKSSSGGSSLKVGEQVRAVAACLAGSRTGLRALPAIWKGAATSEQPSLFMQFLGEVFVAGLASTGVGRLRRSLGPAVSWGYCPVRVLEGNWNLTIGGVEVLRRAARFDPVLERLATIGRQIGYAFEEGDSERLQTHVTVGDERSQPVSVRHRMHERSAVLRFSSPIVVLVGKYSRRKISRDLLLDLLAQNGSAEFGCRVAILEATNEVAVVADVANEALDETKLRTYIDYLAGMASRFIRERRLEQTPPKPKSPRRLRSGKAKNHIAHGRYEL